MASKSGTSSGALSQMHQPLLANNQIQAKFWSKVNKTADCWQWTACVDKDGYGRWHNNAGPTLAHRTAYEWLIGQIPLGLELDHLCRNRACVNPSHLEVVTHLENMRRGSYALQTHCKNGHLFDQGNTYYDNSHPGWQRRNCRRCNALAASRYRMRRKQP